MKIPTRIPAAIAVAALTSVSLAACAGGQTSAGGTTTLTYYSWNNQATMQPIIDAFEDAHPDITIDMSSANGGPAEYAQTLLARASGNQLPDVFHLSLETRNELIDGGVVREELLSSPSVPVALWGNPTLLARTKPHVPYNVLWIVVDALRPDVLASFHDDADERIRHNADIVLTVWNAHSEAQARQRLREFLTDLQACELTLPK